MTQPMLERSPTGPSLEELHVADAMHPGVITCPAETPLREVARMMATYRIHAVAVFAEEPESPTGTALWGVVSDLDLVRVARAGELEECTAGVVAATPIVTVRPNDTLERAAQLMVEHEVTHLVVVERRSARPIGVLSTLDVARAVGGFA